MMVTTAILKLLLGVCFYLTCHCYSVSYHIKVRNECLLSDQSTTN